jgi:sarcosine dehydrogenase
VYTQALNSRGGIESDFTVTQTDDREFMIVTGTAFAAHDFGWLEKQRRENDFNAVEIQEITTSLSCFGLWGPRSREILQRLTAHDLSHENFLFMHSRILTLAGVELRATRITYVGELGWELYLPVDVALTVWKEIVAVGEEFGLKVCGYRAIESLRLEKGYRAWGTEISTETNPWEAGLGFAVALKKDSFIGKSSLLMLRENQVRKLVPIVFEDVRQVPLGNEPIRVGKEVIGRVKSGGQGYSINRGIGYAYLPSKYSGPGEIVEVEFFGAWIKGTIAAEPLFDPTGSRIRA